MPPLQVVKTLRLTSSALALWVLTGALLTALAMSACGSSSHTTPAESERAASCAAMRCAAPPESGCDGPTGAGRAPAGACASRGCEDQEPLTDCAAQDNICVDGACQPSPVRQLSAGSCALRQNGRIDCWDDDLELTRLMHLPDAVALSGGANQGCARHQAGSVSCWGGWPSQASSDRGDHSAPQPISGLTDAVEIGVGSAFTACARRQGGSVVCWGENRWGQLGDGTTEDRSEPRPVMGLTDAVDLSVSGSHSCALRQGGSVVCWGANFKGQLGDGTTTQRDVPTPVSGLTDAIELSAGSHHTCARRQQGSVVCWGAATYGQLGSGDRADDSPVPVAVSGLDDAVMISAGGLHTCAVRRDGSGVCWGSNLHGQLGDGTRYNNPMPSPVLGARAIVELSSSYDHSCARLQSGQILCWGRNHEGQLGHKITLDRRVPRVVKAR